MTRVLVISNQRHDDRGEANPAERAQPGAAPESSESPPDQLAIVHDILAETVALYRNRARRLRWLASTAAFGEAKLEFLALARRYEVLAEHAAVKAQGLRDEAGASAAKPAAAGSSRRRT